MEQTYPGAIRSGNTAPSRIRRIAICVYSKSQRRNRSCNVFSRALVG